MLGIAGGADADSAKAENLSNPSLPELRGTEFDLRIGATVVDITGSPRMATTVNGSLPAPVLRWKQGTTVTLRVTNTLAVRASIHWHGILLPAAMDGVPGISYEGIAPGQTFVYRFPVRQSGTFWYHSHSAFQEQTGIYGALVIDPQSLDPIVADREHVFVLSDWTDEDPERILRKLKAMSDYYNYQAPTVGDFFRDVGQIGWRAAIARRAEFDRMRMNPTDLSDLSSATYTYLVNGLSPSMNWMALAKPGEKVRIRIVNAGASTIFDVRIAGLQMTVVAADGQPVRPVVVDEMRIANAETYDVIVTLPDDRAYTFFAQAIDRMGYARATLAPRPGMMAAVPPLDPRSWLSMEDMGMGDMSGNGDMADMGDMKGMDAAPESGVEDMPAMPGMDGPSATAKPLGQPVVVTTMATGPSVDNRAMSPGLVVTDPGPRLRDNGRKVLTYAQLKTLEGSVDPRPPGRDIVLRLTGNMRRYVWGFDGKKYSEAEPIRLRYGERVRIVLINDTMMSHPIHLHGMWSEVEAEDGSFLVRKHTVNIHPGKRLNFQVTADAPGQWAFHCHHLYHMEAGMFRKVVVA